MSYRLDVNNEYNLVKSKLLRLSLLFALVLTLVLVGDVLLVALSGEEYIAQLIISIANQLNKIVITIEMIIAAPWQNDTSPTYNGLGE